MAAIAFIQLSEVPPNPALGVVILKKQTVLAVTFGRKIGFNLEVLKEQIRYCVQVRICDL